jgi:hypothetical protein
LLLLCCSKLHPDFGEDLLQRQPASSSGVRLPAVLRLSCKVDLLDQVRLQLLCCKWVVLSEGCAEKCAKGLHRLPAVLRLSCKVDLLDQVRQCVCW